MPFSPSRGSSQCRTKELVHRGEASEVLLQPGLELPTGHLALQSRPLLLLVLPQLASAGQASLAQAELGGLERREPFEEVVLPPQPVILVVVQSLRTMRRGGAA